eukprot:TRINITY_DN3141_c0_g3_i2.p1 TRINITY_DN3141_c0_g3~~TRINITY_DN3141_c0_g3_i2.p1  ORF type:complete len:314 (-),score=81.67 TRINITY_DN3141_c0_g3_i2:16-957(-)
MCREAVEAPSRVSVVPGLDTSAALIDPPDVSAIQLADVSHVEVRVKKTAPPRKRKAGAALMDPSVEISDSAFKALLKDTGELVKEPMQKRRRLDGVLDEAEMPDDPFSAPYAPASGVCAELADLLTQRVREIEHVPEDRAQARGGERGEEAEGEAARLQEQEPQAEIVFDVPEFEPNFGGPGAENTSRVELDALASAAEADQGQELAAEMEQDPFSQSMHNVGLVAVPDGAWNKRTLALLTHLQREFDTQKQPVIKYQALVEGKTKRVAARSFFEVLLLKSRGYVDVAQSAPFSDIALSKGPLFDSTAPPVAS